MVFLMFLTHEVFRQAGSPCKTDTTFVASVPYFIFMFSFRMVLQNVMSELLICDVCGRTLKTKRCLTRHSQAHSSTSKYSCQLYKATFANKGHYEGQINSHNNIKPFKCTCSAEIHGFLDVSYKCCIEYTSPCTEFKLTTLVVINTDCTGSCKSKRPYDHDPVIKLLSMISVHIPVLQNLQI
jgi:hypothetical protein